MPINIVLLQRPPFSPEPNHMEKVRDYLRQTKLCPTVRATYDDIVHACQTAWNLPIEDPDRIRSIGKRDRATVCVSWCDPSAPYPRVS